MLWLYAGATLLIGLLFMGVPLIGAPIVIGAISVGIGAYLCRRRPGWASILLLAGGIVVGGTLGVLGEAISHVEGEKENYAAAFILGPADHMAAAAAVCHDPPGTPIVAH